MLGGTMPSRRSPRNGFTLVELLVVLAIVGVLVALLLPAVVFAREAARRSQCKNQLRQLALATSLHDTAHGFFPTGGWGWEYAGDPDAGFGRRQPGGWFYSILPYFEQRDVYALGAGLNGEAKMRAHAQRIETTVPGVICPSRRKNEPIAHRGPPFNGQIVNAGSYSFSSKIDYAVNAGSPEDLECEELRQVVDGVAEPLPISRDEGGCDVTKFDGVSFFHSEVRGKQILDGFSHTYLAGEKYLDPEQYESGIDAGDNESPYSGVNADHYRSTNAKIEVCPDRAGYTNKFAFGSSHSSGFHMAMCDGSVRHVAFAVDPRVHESNGSRQGDEPRK